MGRGSQEASCLSKMRTLTDLHATFWPVRPAHRIAASSCLMPTPWTWLLNPWGKNRLSSLAQCHLLGSSVLLIEQPRHWPMASAPRHRQLSGKCHFPGQVFLCLWLWIFSKIITGRNKGGIFVATQRCGITLHMKLSYFPVCLEMVLTLPCRRNMHSLTSVLLFFVIWLLISQIQGLLLLNYLISCPWCQHHLLFIFLLGHFLTYFPLLIPERHPAQLPPFWLQQNSSTPWIHNALHRWHSQDTKPNLLPRSMLTVSFLAVCLGNSDTHHIKHPVICTLQTNQIHFWSHWLLLVLLT